MSTTSQNILDRAVQRSSMNNAALVSPTEVLAWIGAEQRKLFMMAATLNPEYFGKTGTTTTRTTYTAGWNIEAAPGDVAAITKIRINAITGSVTGLTAGQECSFVTKRFPEWGVTPRVYLRGRTLYGYSTELGAADANMVTSLALDYSELPAAPFDLATTLRLPDEWSTLLELPLAKALALRDGRREDIELLQAEYNSWFGAFREHILTLEHGASRPLQSVPVLPITPSQAN
jgi:hypothetical protein